MTPRFGRLTLVAGVGVLIWLLPQPDGVDPRAWRLLAIFVATVLGVIVKPLPMGAMAVVGIAATVATRTLTIGEALSGFANATVWLVVAAFFLAAGFIKTGLGARIAYVLVTAFGRSTIGLGYSLVAADFVLAPLIPSNTARAGGVIFPVLQSLSRVVFGAESEGCARTRAFLTLAAYNGTVITSAMFITAMVANPLVVRLAADQGVPITWGQWALAAAVPGAVSLAVVPVVIYWLCATGSDATGDAPHAAAVALAQLGPVKRTERLVAAVSVVLLGAWIAGSSIGIDTTAAALIAVAALLVAGVLSWDDLTRDQEAWNTFVWFASLVTMATYLGQFGLTAWFTNEVRSVVGGIGWIAGFLGVVFVYFYSHYFFASNTAHVSAMYAPFLAVALALGTPPLLAALALGFSSNLFASLTHYGTAPAPILFGSGNVSLGAWWKVGAIVSVVNIAIWVGIGAAWWRLLGLW
ncbi:MAG TPA: DASS family sodium-coupled anion symporter [Vicinamibacterales bacterium]